MSSETLASHTAAKPRVSFIVPCYKLAHLLSECVESILCQTYSDFEILIMDDCSPDHTPEVAKSYSDPRVLHIRNEPNLGHLRNYNKGIGLARGEYIWLISADDRLRRNSVLQQYVEVMDANPKLGFAFCPGVALEDGRETNVLEYSVLGSQNRIIRGRDLFARLLHANCILAAAVMVRRDCYDSVSSFPLDLPFGGDWFLWLIFSLHFDAAYFAEAMVNYRYHPQAMSSVLAKENVALCSNDDFNLLWRIHDLLLGRADHELCMRAIEALGEQYGRHLASKTYRGGRQSKMSVTEFETALAEHPQCSDPFRLRATAFIEAADRSYWQKRNDDALRFYRAALALDKTQLKPIAKYLLLRTGKIGITMRNAGSRAKKLLLHRPAASSHLRGT